jgi:DNA-binding transcriptional regulator YhcF (GntR family)
MQPTLRQFEVFLAVAKAGSFRVAAEAMHLSQPALSQHVAEMERDGLVRTRVGQGTFIADNAPAMAPKAREAALDSAIETLLVEAHTLGVPPEELGWRLQRKLEQFARARSDREKEGR